MKKMAEDVYWVGAINFESRNIHGFRTETGTTYNAYLIMDEKITLIDGVEPHFKDEFLRRVAEVVPLDQIDYIVSLHGELDHSGSLMDIHDLAPKSVIVASASEHKTLERHYHREYRKMVVKTGEELNLGKNTLSFVSIPMVHWPDSTVAYLKEQKILFSSDAFGQHYSSVERFSDEVPIELVIYEMKKYFANIVLPYTTAIDKALTSVGHLDIDMILTAHGISYKNKEHIEKVQECYYRWSNHKEDGRAVIVYDTMWGSTKECAYLIGNVLEKLDISYRIYNLHDDFTSITDVLTELMTASYIFVGSPVYNNGILPTIAGFLSYTKGFKLKKKAMAFSSYGWQPNVYQELERLMVDQNWTMMQSQFHQFRLANNEKETFMERVYETVLQQKESM